MNHNYSPLPIEMQISCVCHVHNERLYTSWRWCPTSEMNANEPVTSCHLISVPVFLLCVVCTKPSASSVLQGLLWKVDSSFVPLRKPKIPYLVHKIPPLGTVLTHFHPGPNLIPHLFKIRFNIILLSAPSLPCGPLSWGFPIRTIYPFRNSIMRITRPSYFSSVM